MKKSSMLTKTYCQLHKVWFGQRGLPAWTQRIQPVTTAVCVHKHPISSSCVRRYCTEVSESDHPELKVPSGLGNFPTMEPVNIEKRFRTTENDVTRHEEQHVSKYYDVKKDDYELFYKLGNHSSFLDQVNTFRECRIMVRKPALEVFQMVECVDLDMPPLRILLYGEYGVGKSLTLSHITHRLSNQGFVTVHFPNIKRKVAYRAFRPREMVTGEDGILQHTDEAVEWLQLFQAQNKDKLDDVMVHEECVFTVREKIDANSPISDIINFGIERKQFASICVEIVLKELRQAATDKKIKVLVALDGANIFWKDIAFEKKMVPAQQFMLFRSFMEMLKPTWTNGMIVGTLCSDLAAINDTNLDRKTMDFSPHGILQKEGFKFMDPFIPVEVPRFSKEEAINCLDYYIDNHWISLPHGRTRQGKEELIALSAKQPLELMRICCYW